MYILGLNAYHGGSSACLIKDGQLIAAVEEERLNRIKYWAGFPAKSIQYCLDEAGIEIKDIAHVGISRKPSANLMKKVMFTLRNRPNFGFIRDRLSNAFKVSDPQESFAENFGVSASQVNAQFHNIEHHLAHMASAFLVSPFEEAAILSVDGMGDFVSTMWGMGRGTDMEVLGQVHFPHSLGWFYTAITQWLGFPKYGDEGKVMGLAPYGKPIYLDKMRQIVKLKSDGTFELNPDYFLNHAQGSIQVWRDGAPRMDTLYSEKLIELLGEPQPTTGGFTQYQHDVASSLQAMLEEAELHLLNMLYRKTGAKALCMAGGVALNSAFNGKILLQTPFEDIHIHPAAGDAGTALGAAYVIHNQILEQPRTFVMRDAYTGPSFSNEEIQAVLDSHNLVYEKLDTPELVKGAAEVITDGDVLGWFQGRMEWGPRALGNRSILADPRRADMKEILNARIKYREPFRPFAPSLAVEATDDYFEQDYPDPFMLKVYNVREEKRDVIPAVTHVDGTGRLQTVDKEDNPLYWALIKAVEEISGVPIVLNTSFNENEPIVCTPQEAVACFLRTKMDAIGIGNFLVKKKDQA